MAKTKEITIGGGIKLSINYQTVEGHVSITKTLEEGDDLQQVKEEIYKELDQLLKETVSKNYKLLKAAVQNFGKEK